ncbi:MAG: hypothetical protein HZB45_28465 [Mycolicibacterium rufum]|uniref:Uncharacterized protein n=1 Tax=Mycolicibacterium chlorophenolicum TaxID=37916 RepID=A0A0J6VM35_9MYCO|nr:hypothetical protein [Mycolicibacterium chlorophenolicum]KMO70513.1 hypothetical protein MCHLDSM_05402 [Mycolicibacterium chlorophenolicum]MBI5341631.1 hypothetical protein [Mycolicibacterium rufum]
MDDDPDQTELDEVRRELRRFAADDAAAPEVPAEVTARVGAALRNAPSPRRRFRFPRLR